MGFMGRPPMPLGAAGKVRTYPVAGGYRARTTYRDYDGVTRELQRVGPTEAAAKRTLSEAVRDRVRIGSGQDFTPDTRVSEVAEAWYSDAVVRELSPTTL